MEAVRYFLSHRPQIDSIYLNSTSLDRSHVGSVIMDIKAMAAEFTSPTFRHVNRSLNGAAHG